MLVGRARRAVAAAAVLLVPLDLIAGCSSAPAAPQVSPAPQAASPECATALDAAPATVLDHPRTSLSVAGAAAWGSPPIVVRCGLPEPGPTTLPCVSVNGIDWVVDDGADPMTAVSYGRSPAVEVEMPTSYDRASLPAALVDLGPVASALPTTAHTCIG